MPTGVLAFATPYSWSVSYKDSKGAQGPASTPTSFTTQPAPNRPPQAPTNLSPPDGSANQPLTLTLQASAFSDPDGDSHASSQWIIKRSADNTTVLDSGADTANKTSITVLTGVLSFATTSSFFFNDTATTEIYTLSLHDALPISQPAPNRPPQAPTNLSPLDGATNQLLTLTLQASAFSDPDGN